MNKELEAHQFAENEILEIEVDSMSTNQLVGRAEDLHVVKDGKTRFNILAQNLHLWLNLVEEDMTTLDNAKKAWQKNKAVYDSILQKNGSFTKEEVNMYAAAKKAITEKNPQVVFRTIMGRDHLPFRSVKVVASSGLKKTKEVEMAEAQMRSAQVAMDMLLNNQALNNNKSAQQAENEDLKARIEKLEKLLAASLAKK